MDSLVASLGAIYNGFFEVTSGMTVEARKKLFARNVRRFYRLGEARA